MSHSPTKIRRIAILAGLTLIAFILVSGSILSAQTSDGGTFVDDDGNTHEAAIEALSTEGITRGCDEQGILFCPDRPVSRGEIAAFLTRSLSFPDPTTDHFDDDQESTFEADINRIAEAGLARGCNPPANTLYCPDRTLTRAEMATLLVRAVPDNVPDTAPDAFTDDDSSVHEQNIDRIAAAGITLGCNPPDNTNFCPRAEVTRAETASFLVRAFGLDRIDVLVFSKTEGFRHPSIEPGVAALNELAADGGFEVAATEEASTFTTQSLARFDVVIFLNTTHDVLSPAQQMAMEEFIASDNGFVGIHSAADTEYDWPWYGGLVGAYFDSHPEQQTATVEVVEPSHPVVAGLQDRFERFDEWYNYQTLPGMAVTVLATIDEATYSGGNMGEPHPIIWAQEFGGGRAVYTGFGHTVESYSEPLMRTLLVNAIKWANGLE